MLKNTRNDGVKPIEMTGILLAIRKPGFIDPQNYNIYRRHLIVSQPKSSFMNSSG